MKLLISTSIGVPLDQLRFRGVKLIGISEPNTDTTRSVIRFIKSVLVNVVVYRLISKTSLFLPGSLCLYILDTPSK